MPSPVLLLLETTPVGHHRLDQHTIMASIIRTSLRDLTQVRQFLSKKRHGQDIDVPSPVHESLPTACKSLPPSNSSLHSSCPTIEALVHSHLSSTHITSLQTCNLLNPLLLVCQVSHDGVLLKCLCLHHGDNVLSLRSSCILLVSRLLPLRRSTIWDLRGRGYLRGNGVEVVLRDRVSERLSRGKTWTRW